MKHQSEFLERGQDRVVRNMQDAETFGFQLVKGVAREFTRQHCAEEWLVA